MNGARLLLAAAMKLTSHALRAVSRHPSRTHTHCSGPVMRRGRLRPLTALGCTPRRNQAAAKKRQSLRCRALTRAAVERCMLFVGRGLRRGGTSARHASRQAAAASALQQRRRQRGGNSSMPEGSVTAAGSSAGAMTLPALKRHVRQPPQQLGISPLRRAHPPTRANQRSSGGDGTTSSRVLRVPSRGGWPTRA